MSTLLYLKWMSNKGLLYSAGNSAQCYLAAWMGGEFGGECIHVYVWLSPLAVNQLLWLYLSTKQKVKKKGLCLHTMSEI